MIKSNKWHILLFTVLMAFAFALPTIAAETKGKIKTIDYTNNKLVFTDVNAKDWTFLMAKEAKIFLNDKEMKLGDLKADDEARVIYEKRDDNLMISEIRATRK